MREWSRDHDEYMQTSDHSCIIADLVVNTFALHTKKGFFVSGSRPSLRGSLSILLLPRLCFFVVVEKFVKVDHNSRYFGDWFLTFVFSGLSCNGIYAYSIFIYSFQRNLKNSFSSLSVIS